MSWVIHLVGTHENASFSICRIVGTGLFLSFCVCNSRYIYNDPFICILIWKGKSTHPSIFLFLLCYFLYRPLAPLIERVFLFVREEMIIFFENIVDRVYLYLWFTNAIHKTKAHESLSVFLSCNKVYSFMWIGMVHKSGPISSVLMCFQFCKSVYFFLRKRISTM